jgi:large conductance mechanosensitive channel
MFSGFKKFLLRGNVVDLAVAVVIGAAFGAVVTSLVSNILTPLIAAIAGKPDFSSLSVTINGSQIMYGTFLNALISFLTIAAAIYFFIVAPLNAYTERRHRGEAPADPTTKKCPECLSEIPIAAHRCAFCTASVDSMAAQRG